MTGKLLEKKAYRTSFQCCDPQDKVLKPEDIGVNLGSASDLGDFGHKVLL